MYEIDVLNWKKFKRERKKNDNSAEANLIH